jgi:hypothetical protein
MHAMTCGELFRDAMQSHTDMSPEQIRVFAAGYVTGQAEKIYLGACAAAMFRPSPEHYDMLAVRAALEQPWRGRLFSIRRHWVRGLCRHQARPALRRCGTQTLILPSGCT